MPKKMYVGNLSYEADETALREIFASVGEVQSVKIVTDSATGRSRGFGFIEMTSDEDVDRAIATLNGTKFMDRTLVVNEARPQTDRGRSRDSRRGPGRAHTRGRGSGFWR